MIVKYNRAGVFNADGIILKPGNNTITDIKAWQKARQHPTVKAMMESTPKQPDPLIEELFDVDEQAKLTPDKQNEANASYLQNLKPPEAKRIVEETVEIPLLESWMKVEKRNQIKGAIKAQIEKLNAPPEERDRSESRQVHAGVTTTETVVNNPDDKE